MTDLKPQVKNRYSSFIASICTDAIDKTAGINITIDNRTHIGLKNKNIHVYFDAEEVFIDMYVNVDYNVAIPEVACALQETVKNDVEKATTFKVKRVNIHVTSIN